MDDVAREMSPMIKFWVVNCVAYASVVAWYLVNNLKCEIKSNIKKKKVKYKWLEKIDDEIAAKRKLLSQCVAEIERLKTRGRITRKTKRNRERFFESIGEISVYSLTKLACKLKAEIRKKANLRKKKLKNQQARDLNQKFNSNQSEVFRSFRGIIDEDKERELPVYKEIEKERKFFNDADTVVNFWKSLWCKEDQGHPDAEWLEEYKSLFEKEIPGSNNENILLEPGTSTKAIKKKRNWSAPGPDLLVNFWLKRLSVIHLIINETFMDIINSGCSMEAWFCRGRTSLLEKPGEWLHDNTRPITCTNNMYKWFTTVLQQIFHGHIKKHEVLQMDQRGAKENCSGTHENLLIDSMVLKDARDKLRNLACVWVDVRKAYDSLSHSWALKMLEIHKFPTKLQNVIREIMSNWNTVLIVPLEDADFASDPIQITNGVFQGDVLSGDVFKLSLNPISWELRRYDGYTLSRPLSTKITHTFFMDDLKAYAKTLMALINLMSEIKKKMSDGGLEWNAKKCNVLNIIRGRIDKTTVEVVLYDGTKVKCLKLEELYKFLGVPENELHDVENIVEKSKKTVQQRTNVTWTSPLSEYNKVVATNIFVHSSLEYFMWSEKFNLGDLREIDQLVRNIMNNVKAKYKLQANASLYIPRNQGGRGLKHLETTYKRTKVVAAMNLLTRIDPRIELVKEFERIRMKKGKSSILTDAVRYAAEDFGVKFEPLENNFVVHYEKEGETISTSNKEAVKDILKKKATERLVGELTSSTWQGVNFKTRYDDKEVDLGQCFAWLSRWRNAPVDLINNFQSIYLQTVPTLTFKKFRGDTTITSTTCRLCGKRDESVKHLLSNCERYVNHAYKRRHDRVLQYIMFKYLHKNKLIAETPPWFTKICIKPHYTNDEIEVFWDIPEYSGYENETEIRPLRPDGKIINKELKTILVLEMSIPWITNREEKIEEKVLKYTNIVQNLKVDNPGYIVKQLTFIIDCMGGYSKSLVDNLTLLGLTKEEVNSLLPGIQRIVVTEAVSVINNFKVATLE